METVKIVVNTPTLGEVAQENIDAIRKLASFYNNITLEQLRKKFDQVIKRFPDDKRRSFQSIYDFVSDAYEIGTCGCKICATVNVRCSICFWKIYYSQMKSQLHVTDGDLGLIGNIADCCTAHETLFNLTRCDSKTTVTKRSLPAVLKLMHARGKYITNLFKSLNL